MSALRWLPVQTEGCWKLSVLSAAFCLCPPPAAATCSCPLSKARHLQQTCWPRGISCRCVWKEMNFKGFSLCRRPIKEATHATFSTSPASIYTRSECCTQFHLFVNIANVWNKKCISKVDKNAEFTRAKHRRRYLKQIFTREGKNSNGCKRRFWRFCRHCYPKYYSIVFPTELRAETTPPLHMTFTNPALLFCVIWPY